MMELSALRSQSLSAASDTIWSSIAEQPTSSGDLCDSIECCKISDTELCPLSSFPLDDRVLVYPGGETSCIFSTSTDYAFTVYRGDPDKVLIYFQGGGACWDEMSTDLEFCSTNAVPNDEIGIFDRMNPDNPYSDFTIVEILYCSGDLHAGNVVRDYFDSAGQPVVQVGQINTQSVLDWIITQQLTTLSAVDQLVLSGCSAGSIGVQVWSDILLSSLTYHHAAIVPDSYAGVFPEGSQGPLIYDYGICPWLTDLHLKSLCNQQILTLQDITETYMKANPDIAYAFIQSKADDVQIAFYTAIAVSYEIEPYVISPEEFYSQVNDIFIRYSSTSSSTTTRRRRRPSNLVSYLLNGPVHCYTPRSGFYQADTSGRGGSDVNGLGPDLKTWVELLPPGDDVNDIHKVGGECWGLNKVKDDWNGIRYCAQELQSRDFIQK